MREPFFAALFVLALAPGGALAFSGEVHTAISREALAHMGYDRTAGQEVVTGNLKTDQDEFWDVQAHFDNEAFSEGSKRLKIKLKASLDALANCDVGQAREQLGRALHPTQDFFSHSNWVENHEPDESVDLLGLQDPAEGVTCVPGSHEGPLTSGYYYREENHRPPRGKCLHAELHKDDASRPFHEEARARALAETKRILAYFERIIALRFSRVGPREAGYRIRLLKDASPEFAPYRERCRPIR